MHKMCAPQMFCILCCIVFVIGARKCIEPQKARQYTFNMHSKIVNKIIQTFSYIQCIRFELPAQCTYTQTPISSSEHCFGNVRAGWFPVRAFNPVFS